MIKVRMSRMFVECGEIECWGSWSRKSETNIQSGSDRKFGQAHSWKVCFSQESLLARLIQEKAVEHHPELWITYCSVWHSLSHPRVITTWPCNFDICRLFENHTATAPHTARLGKQRAWNLEPMLVEQNAMKNHVWSLNRIWHRLNVFTCLHYQRLSGSFLIRFLQELLWNVLLGLQAA